MDVVRPRERPISILNDNDSPSFAVRPKQPLLSAFYYSKEERPIFPRLDAYSPCDLPTTTPSTPPLSRLNSTSSKASSSTMDSPSPKTPVYSYDPQLIAPSDPILRQDHTTIYLPSPSTGTPLMDPMMVIAPSSDQLLAYQAKSTNSAMPSNYPGLPLSPPDGQRALTPSSSSKSNSQPQASNPAAGSPVKKNKYPCPYASSHHCTATFTTSGHAARHGKKHTGEKGVHCPVCDKAFTRKDNMKQHERTHKTSVSGSNSDDTSHKRSKAAVSKDTSRVKLAAAEVTQSPNEAGLIHSPLSEVVSINPSVISTPSLAEDHNHYNDASMAHHPEAPRSTSAYPPLGDEPAFSTLSQLDRSPSLASPQAPLQRTYADLHTLALAAAYDPYSQGNINVR
jgi:Zinc finger, C2H2 type